jgi:hypothetical protein
LRLWPTTLHIEKELACYVLTLGLGGTQVLDDTAKPERMMRDVKTAAEVRYMYQ